jgi:hypothetical protein
LRKYFCMLLSLLHEFLMDFAYFPRNQFMIFTVCFFLVFFFLELFSTFRFSFVFFPFRHQRQLNERKMSEIYCVILLKYLNLILDLAEDFKVGTNNPSTQHTFNMSAHLVVNISQTFFFSPLSLSAILRNALYGIKIYFSFCTPCRACFGNVHPFFHRKCVYDMTLYTMHANMC